MSFDLNEFISETKGLHDVSQVDPSTISFTYNFEDKRLAKIFIDSSGVIEQGADEAISKQKFLVEKDFFKSQGSLQWNFYYYYLVNDNIFEKSRDSGLIKKIEGDTNYARKRVFTIDSLKKSYPFSSIFENETSQSGTFKELSNEWIEILKSHQLFEVYSEGAVEGAIKRYLEGKPIVEDEMANSFGASESIDIPKAISNVKLKKYRKHTPNKEYKFSKINLIEGSNGTGKTSLLEAIELLMCGKSFRHSKLPVEVADISLLYSGQSNDEAFTPDDLKKYKLREETWYGVPFSNRSNTLFNSFNRFNFFNTDASFRLSTETEPQKILETFRALALGSRTTELGMRISRFEEKFRTEARRIEKDLEGLNLEIEKDKANLADLQKNTKKVDIDQSRIEKFLQRTLSINQQDVNASEGLSTVQSVLSPISINLKTIVSEYSLVKPLNLNFFEDENLHLKFIGDEKLKFEGRRAGLKSQMELKVKAGTELKEEQKKREEIIRYLENAEAFSMIQNQNAINQISSKVSKYSVGLSSLKTGDLQDSTFDNNSTLESLKVLAAQRDELRKSILEIDSKISDKKKSIDGLKAIVLEIKSAGRRYVNHSKDGICPLCQTQFEFEELENKINHIASAADTLTPLLEEKTRLNGLLATAEDELSRIVRLANSVKAFSDFDAHQSISSLKRQIFESEAELKSLNVELENKRSIYTLLNDQGFLSERLFELLEHFEIKDALEEQRVGLLEGLRQKVAAGNRSLDDLRKDFQKLKEDIAENEKQYLDKVKPYLGATSVDDVKDEYENRLSKINKISSAIERIKSTISLSSDDDLTEMSSTASQLLYEVKEYATYMAALESNKKGVELVNKRLEEKGVQHKSFEERKMRAQNALDAFKKINEEYGEEKAVQSFFTQNKPTIIDIFKSIHFPNEFDDIVLEKDNIYVKRGEDQWDLSQISTGQRSALAISVFLGMHLSCPMAPKIILFDDPIAFIDDLNILAFIDFLRELAIKGNRQIFFATANRKVASLMHRKFDLLKEEFKFYNLSTIQS